MSELISWLRSTIEGDKAAAEAAGAPRLIKVSVKDENGYRWDKKPVEYSGEWQVAGDGDAVEPVCPEAEAIVSASCGCCCSTSEGLDADLKHIAIHDPRDTIARCEAELVELDVIEAIPHQRVHDDEWFSCSQARDEHGELSCYHDNRVGEPCDCGRDALVDRLIRAKAYGYRHRPGFNPEWVAE
ncbi:DUF6221 family protein [Streptosporangium sp. G12]